MITSNQTTHKNQYPHVYLHSQQLLILFTQLHSNTLREYLKWQYTHNDIQDLADTKWQKQVPSLDLQNIILFAKTIVTEYQKYKKTNTIVFIIY